MKTFIALCVTVLAVSTVMSSDCLKDCLGVCGMGGNGCKATDLFGNLCGVATGLCNGTCKAVCNCADSCNDKCGKVEACFSGVVPSSTAAPTDVSGVTDEVVGEAKALEHATNCTVQNSVCVFKCNSNCYSNVIAGMLTPSSDGH